MTNTYTVLSCDIVTGRILADLPVKPSSMSWVHNGSGTINDLTVPMAPLLDRYRSDDVMSLTAPGRTALYVDLNGSLVWGGPVWRRTYSSASRACTIGAASWWDYWLRKVITTPVQFRSTDQFDIVRTLLTLDASRTGYVNLTLSTADSGVTRTVSYEPSDLKKVGEVIAELSDNISGFEFAVDVRWGADGLPERVFQLGSPRLGQIEPATGLVLEYREDPATGRRSGNVASYEWPEDGTTLATETWGAAQADSGASILSSAAAPDLIAAGYPILYGTLEGHDTVVLKATLDGYVQAQQRANATPSVTPTFVIDHGGDTLIGQWMPRDDALVEITDLRWPSPDGMAPGLRQWVRTTEASLDVAKEKISVTVAPIDTTVPLPRGVRKPTQSRVVRRLVQRVRDLENGRPDAALGAVHPDKSTWPAVSTVAWTSVGQTILWRASPTVVAVVYTSVPGGNTAQARLRLFAAPGAIGEGNAGLDAAGDFVDIPAGDSTVLVTIDTPSLWLVGWAVHASVEVARSSGTGTIRAHVARIDQR